MKITKTLFKKQFEFEAKELKELAELALYIRDYFEPNKQIRNIFFDIIQAIKKYICD